METSVPRLHSPSPRGPGSPASQPISHLLDEGVSDFPVTPLSRLEVVTHSSLLPIIALAWAWGQIIYDQLGTWDVWPPSPSLHGTISQSQVSPAKRHVLQLRNSPARSSRYLPRDQSWYHREQRTPGQRGLRCDHSVSMYLLKGVNTCGHCHQGDMTS